MLVFIQLFHVSRLKEFLGFGENIATLNDIWGFVIQASFFRTNYCGTKLYLKHINQFSIKWMDKTIDDATWERENTLKAQFLNFIL